MKYTEKQQKQIAKLVAKAMKKYNINFGILKGNGSTTPPNPKAFENFIIVEPTYKGDYFGCGSRELIYISFKEDSGISYKIKEALETEKIPFKWEGFEYYCFEINLNDFKLETT